MSDPTNPSKEELWEIFWTAFDAKNDHFRALFDAGVAAERERAATENEAEAETIARVLRESGISEDAAASSLHSWRCDYPDRYGKCDCFESLMNDIVAALASRRVPVVPEQNGEQK